MPMQAMLKSFKNIYLLLHARPQENFQREYFYLRHLDHVFGFIVSTLLVASIEQLMNHFYAFELKHLSEISKYNILQNYRLQIFIPVLQLLNSNSLQQNQF